MVVCVADWKDVQVLTALSLQQLDEDHRVSIFLQGFTCFHMHGTGGAVAGPCGLESSGTHAQI
jgi:hypothetical protein